MTSRGLSVPPYCCCDQEHREPCPEQGFKEKAESEGLGFTRDTSISGARVWIFSRGPWGIGSEQCSLPVLSFPKGTKPSRNFSSMYWLEELGATAGVVEELRWEEGNNYMPVCFTYRHDFNLMLEMRKDPGTLVSRPGLIFGHETLSKLLYWSVDQFHLGWSMGTGA